MTLRRILHLFSIDDRQLASGACAVARLHDLDLAVGAIDARAEPWLAHWLRDELWKAEVLYAAAKVNWTRDQQGGVTPGQRRMRMRILERFNEWVVELQDRMSSYESGPRDATVVAPWIEELARFQHDPVGNL